MPMNPELLANPKAERVRHVAELANAKARRRAGRFLVEGPQSVREAVACCPDAVRDLYVQADDAANAAELANGAHTAALTRSRIVETALGAGVYVHQATPEVLSRISSNAQGIAAVVDVEELSANGDAVSWPDDIDDTDDVADTDGTDGADNMNATMIAAFWQVRDPGNAGTVIRSADAAGCAAVVFVDDCVDVFNPKVVRSTAGSLFHVPVLSMGTEEFFAWTLSHDCPVIAADVYGTAESRPQSLPDFLRGGSRDAAAKAVLFGNEARGLPEEILVQAQHIVSIPIYGKAESLNLATSAAVMLFSMAMSSHIGTM
ncbi:MAG: RNA methyltransferase [Bifidobacterium tibiigranuli]|jgi:TrmH family RNA methyltransferase|uniref:TrmH family RNA methyltransferase n=1 Tax=Bifidobacterium tibiigranuli TaxID=2172043 RepID=UPI0023563750|nr:RNA methyltransferase [Bifidobacterium tibiigranuli]MCH3974320.1 RNA methyltransferase [Bifidobacterium tibiigranuli]MCH4188883.1 RNA methyltransferase [Bifidobacterium tibiigranuli]MCH4203212.1 RNA methyltransferase [Bifidobacterium tibiigranuli]MCH4273445.1 RNA methyltransferase [Bifidobacterium tibiigranuli]MCI1790559.1 RNA methyltransferase [Bifidobacterium tibiigranuli]